ncbi:hypothetical protein C0995_004912 [Termitomyces sp. Mi166|nr:hypothetical protein C0995_004912 [Termitomyces sp. Mi166\
MVRTEFGGVREKKGSYLAVFKLHPLPIPRPITKLEPTEWRLDTSVNINIVRPENQATFKASRSPLEHQSASAWTNADLTLCNANVVEIDAIAFFGVGLRDLPAPNVSPAILNTKATYPQQPHPLHTHMALTNDERLFFNYLEAAMVPSDKQTQAIIDFTTHVLHILGFTESKPSKLHPEHGGRNRRVIRRDHDLPLFMCGRTVHTTADACLLFPSTEGHTADTVLLIVKAAPFPACGSECSAEAQLFAQAIGAFQCYNRDRRRARLPPLDSKVFLGLVMRGTTPMLYRMEITVALVECVQSAQRPPKVTYVQRLQLPLDRKSALVEGMIPLANRRILLGYLEAFKELI